MLRPSCTVVVFLFVVVNNFFALLYYFRGGRFRGDVSLLELLQLGPFQLIQIGLCCSDFLLYISGLSGNSMDFINIGVKLWLIRGPILWPSFFKPQDSSWSRFAPITCEFDTLSNFWASTRVKSLLNYHPGSQPPRHHPRRIVAELCQMFRLQPLLQ